MENDCVAFGHYLNYFPEENTTIFNFQLSIFNSLGRAISRNLLFFARQFAQEGKAQDQKAADELRN